MSPLFLMGTALAGAPGLADPALPTERRHMAILGVWTGANLVGGSVGFALARTPEGRAFHGTNAAWNTVNAAIVVAGVAGIHKRSGQIESIEVLRKRHRRFRTALAINLGLDVLYVGSGLALWGFGGELAGTDLSAVGESLVLQGGFLMAFDAAFLTSHHQRAGDVTIGPGSVSFRF